jgi:hypothetical protein
MAAYYYAAVMFFFGTATTTLIFNQFFLNTTATPHCVCASWYESRLFNPLQRTSSAWSSFFYFSCLFRAGEKTHAAFLAEEEDMTLLLCFITILISRKKTMN